MEKFTTIECNCGKIYHSHIPEKQYLCSEKKLYETNSQKHYRKYRLQQCSTTVATTQYQYPQIRGLYQQRSLASEQIDDFANFFGVDRITLITEKTGALSHR